jgi:hypothetical protein
MNTWLPCNECTSKWCGISERLIGQRLKPGSFSPNYERSLDVEPTLQFGQIAFHFFYEDLQSLKAIFRQQGEQLRQLANDQIQLRYELQLQRERDAREREQREKEALQRENEQLRARLQQAERLSLPPSRKPDEE